MSTCYNLSRTGEFGLANHIRFCSKNKTRCYYEKTQVPFQRTEFGAGHHVFVQPHYVARVCQQLQGEQPRGHALLLQL